MRMYMGSLLTSSTIPEAHLLVPYFFMAGAQAIKLRAENPKRASIAVESACIMASFGVILFHYLSGGIQTSGDRCFFGIAAFANVVYLLLPMAYRM